MSAFTKKTLSPCGHYTIRPVEPQDNASIAGVILAVLTDFGCIGEGYASNDPELQYMYENYQDAEGQYWVVEENETGRILGGVGFSRLKGTTTDEAICELQKLYFMPELRGKGLAKFMLDLCLEQAVEGGFKRMYLESIPQMTTAIGMYERFGFKHLSERMGNTGHSACPVFMLRELPVLAVVS